MTHLAGRNNVTIDKAEDEEDSNVRRTAPADENVTNDSREREERWKIEREKEEREMKNPSLNPPLSFVTHLRPWYRRIDFTFLDCHLSRFRTGSRPTLLGMTSSAIFGDLTRGDLFTELSCRRSVSRHTVGSIGLGKSGCVRATTAIHPSIIMFRNSEPP